MKLLSLAALAGLLFLPSIAGAAIEFTGVLASKDTTRFSLRDTTANGVSPWLTLGDSFSGYTLSNYDTKTEILLLVKGNEKLPLHLTPGKIIEAPPSPPRPNEHVTKAGDTLMRIAQQYQMTIPELMDLNPGIVPSQLKVGQKLRLR